MTNLHVSNCCKLHGCAYGTTCAVASGFYTQLQPCVECPTIEEAREALKNAKIQLDFLVDLTSMIERKVV